MRLLIILQVAVVVVGSDESNLPGHMQPLGSHRPPEESIPILSRVPDPLQFYENYMKPQIPVQFKGAIAGTPALTKWSDDEYLSNSFGDEMVGIELGKKEDRNGSGDITTIGDFLKRYKQEDVYMVHDMPVGMQKEWQVPRCLLCGGYTDYLNFCYIWFSSGGTKSVLHTDSYENLHCLASGIKEFVLIHPDYIKVIGPEHKELGYYHIDVERVNMTSHPGMAEVPWYHVRVEAGDCLYIPFEWIHHVSSHGRNLGVNIWWTDFNFQRHKCPKDMSNVPDFMPLSKFNFHPEKQILSVFLSLAHDDGYIYVDDLAEKLPMYNMEMVHQIMEMLDPGCNGRLLASKLADDIIPQERYDNLFLFINTLNEQQEFEQQELEMLRDNDWLNPPDGEEWVEEEAVRDSFVEEDGDDIEVPSKKDVDQFLRQHSGKVKNTHNEL